MSSSSVASFCLARPRWKTSCSVFPPAVKAATVTRLRSFGDSCGRVQASPKSTSSVKCTSAGARSPNILSAPEGSLFCALSSAMSVSLLVWVGGRPTTVRGSGRAADRRGRSGSVRDEPEGRRDGVVPDHRDDVGLAVAGVRGSVRLILRGAYPGVRLGELEVASDAAGPRAALVRAQRRGSCLRLGHGHQWTACPT